MGTLLHLTLLGVYRFQIIERAFSPSTFSLYVFLGRCPRPLLLLQRREKCINSSPGACAPGLKFFGQWPDFWHNRWRT